jgi:hypothetical protein
MIRVKYHILVTLGAHRILWRIKHHTLAMRGTESFYKYLVTHTGEKGHTEFCDVLSITLCWWGGRQLFKYLVSHTGDVGAHSILWRIKHHSLLMKGADSFLNIYYHILVTWGHTVFCYGLSSTHWWWGEQRAFVQNLVSYIGDVGHTVFCDEGSITYLR